MLSLLVGRAVLTVIFNQADLSCSLRVVQFPIAPLKSVRHSPLIASMSHSLVHFFQRAVSSSLFFCAQDRLEVFDFSKNAMNFELSLPLVVPYCSLDGFVVDFSVLLLYPLVHAFDPLNERFDLFIFFIFSASVLGIG